MQSKADAAPLLLFQNFDVMFAICIFHLILTRGLGPERSRILSFIQVVQYADPDINSHKSLKKTTNVIYLYVSDLPGLLLPVVLAVHSAVDHQIT